MIYKATENGIFSEEGSIRDNLKFKDVRPIREAVIVNELSHLPQTKLKRFVESPECNQMMKMDILSPETVENLAKNAYGDRATEFMCCHMAKENGDDRWDELVQLRAQERALLNSLIRDYAEESKSYAQNYRQDFVNKCVPKEYQTGE